MCRGRYSSHGANVLFLTCLIYMSYSCNDKTDSKGEEVNLLFLPLSPCPLLMLPKRMLAADGKTSITSWTEVSALVMRLMVLYCTVLFQTQYVLSDRKHRFLILKKMKNKSLSAWVLQLFFSITLSNSVLQCIYFLGQEGFLCCLNTAEAQESLVASDSTIHFIFLARNCRLNWELLESQCEDLNLFCATVSISDMAGKCWPLWKH